MPRDNYDTAKRIVKAIDNTLFTVDIGLDYDEEGQVIEDDSFDTLVHVVEDILEEEDNVIL